MKKIERTAWRRRHWLALCVSTLVAACGGGAGAEAGRAVWGSASARWDGTTWN